MRRKSLNVIVVTLFLAATVAAQAWSVGLLAPLPSSVNSQGIPVPPGVPPPPGIPVPVPLPPVA